MTERLIRLGIDYGTSFSKVVFRDYGAPGGEKAFVMAKDENFRSPSAVGVKGEDFIFGTDPRRYETDSDIVWHESIKMRVAGEIKRDYERYCYGPRLPLPLGFSAKDIAVLSVWFLISEAKRAVREHLQTFHGTIVIGFTLGVPMSFFDDPELKRVFLSISQSAWELSKVTDLDRTISFHDARRSLDSAYVTVEGGGDVDSDEIKNWIRTEAEAALWWPFMSPAIDEGPYAQIDIGAGTTNIGVFRIVPKHTPAGWVKASVSFFGACSPPVGMDAIDKAIAELEGDSNEFAWRGRETQILYGRVGHQLVSPEASQIRDAYKQTINKAFSTHLRNQAEWRVWRDHKLFMLGGGSLIDCLVEQLRESPIDEEKMLSIVALDVPPDIRQSDGREVPTSMFPHVAVAYGLSGYSSDLPNVKTPSETPQMRNVNPVSLRYQLIETDEWRY